MHKFADSIFFSIKILNSLLELLFIFHTNLLRRFHSINLLVLLLLQGVPKKSVNKEISITFEQMATQRCVRSQIGGIFGCWAHLNNCQEYSMCPSCVYTCLNICNPCTIFISSKVMLISLFTFFWGHPVERCFKMVRYQMSHCYFCSKSKTNINKWYLEDFRANNFPALNKKDPVFLLFNCQ